jgi:hypothetical protein
MAKKRRPLPRHLRVKNPPRMRLTRRDIDVVAAVRDHRVLRTDQIQRLLFPSRNTANERLKRLYQHGFLERRWLPVEYGKGMGQAIYLLASRGAEILAMRHPDQPVRWRGRGNQVGSPFLEHSLMLNDIRIAFTLAARENGYLIERWVGENELKAAGEYVWVRSGDTKRRRVALIPDGYCLVNMRGRKARFFFEADRGTLSGRRWAWRVRAYLAYVRSGRYAAKYGARSLRVLTVTTGPKRLAHLRRATERAGGGRLFWFTTHEQTQSEQILGGPIWAVAGQSGQHRLITGAGGHQHLLYSAQHDQATIRTQTMGHPRGPVDQGYPLPGP